MTDQTPAKSNPDHLRMNEKAVAFVRHFVDHEKPIAHEVGVAHRLCAEYGMKIGSDGVQLLGGHGYVKEHPVERWYRDLRAAGVLEGGVLV